MVGVLIFGLILGALVGAVGQVVVRHHRKLGPEASLRPLPAPGPAPENRAEAVRRVLKHLQRKTIAELEDGGAAVIVGTVKAMAGVAPLHSPLTGTQCLGFHLDVRHAELDASLRFAQLLDLAQIVEIEVTDATGTVRVSADSLELAITDGPIGRWHPPLPPALWKLVPRQFLHLPVTVEEGLLQPGMTVLVCGVAVRELGVTDYRDGASTLVLRATATFPLVASTDPDLLVQGDRPIAAEELHRRS